jgi:hypothetical protein
MPKIHRVMTLDGDHPVVTNSARGLGVRAGGGPNDDIPVTSSSDVNPETGGMSVAPTWRDLPVQRIPRRLKDLAPGAVGSNRDTCWRMGEGDFIAGKVAQGLVLRPDSANHGLVEPEVTMPLNDFVKYVALTRDSWIVDEV